LGFYAEEIQLTLSIHWDWIGGAGRAVLLQVEHKQQLSRLARLQL